MTIQDLRGVLGELVRFLERHPLPPAGGPIAFVFGHGPTLQEVLTPAGAQGSELLKEHLRRRVVTGRAQGYIVSPGRFTLITELADRTSNSESALVLLGFCPTDTILVVIGNTTGAVELSLEDGAFERTEEWRFPFPSDAVN